MASARRAVYASPEQLARQVVRHGCRLVREHAGAFCAALSGGNTPRAQYQLLASAEFRETMPWDRLECFFSDGRSVPRVIPILNCGTFLRALQDRVQVNVHPMPAPAGDDLGYETLPAAKPLPGQQGCPNWTWSFSGWAGRPQASLFPGTGALLERQRLVVMNEVPQLSTRRMTFTYR